MTTTTTGTAEVLSELGLDRQNQATLGRLLLSGGIAHAEQRPDGSMHARLRVVPEQMTWDPTILVMPHRGDLELDIVNDDGNTHCALLPSNGDRQFLWLPAFSKGTAGLSLDGPGYYWFNSPIGNDEGQGLIGAIVVLGDAPPEARLDRPQQPRP